MFEIARIPASKLFFGVGFCFLGSSFALLGFACFYVSVATTVCHFNSPVRAVLEKASWMQYAQVVQIPREAVTSYLSDKKTTIVRGSSLVLIIQDCGRSVK